jgi:hypothetical protein
MDEMIGMPSCVRFRRISGWANRRVIEHVCDARANVRVDVTSAVYVTVVLLTLISQAPQKQLCQSGIFSARNPVVIVFRWTRPSFS